MLICKLSLLCARAPDWLHTCTSVYRCERVRNERVYTIPADAHASDTRQHMCTSCSSRLWHVLHLEHTFTKCVYTRGTTSVTSARRTCFVINQQCWLVVSSTAGLRRSGLHDAYIPGEWAELAATTQTHTWNVTSTHRQRRSRTSMGPWINTYYVHVQPIWIEWNGRVAARVHRWMDDYWNMMANVR